MKRLLALFVCLISNSFFGQQEIAGFVKLPEGWHNEIYLSAIYDYREMAEIQNSQVIAVTTVDSSGFFEFSSPVFNDNELIYRLHLAPDSGEVEVFLADFSENGFGYNHVIFIAKKGDQVFFEMPDHNIFGTIESDNSASEKWQTLNQQQNVFNASKFNLGVNQMDHLIVEHQQKMVEMVEHDGAVAGIIAAYFILEEDVNLSSNYMNAYNDNRAFFYEVLKELESNHLFYADRLKKELAVIDLQLDGDKLLKLQNRVYWLYLIIGLLLCVIAFLLFWRFTKKEVTEKVQLTTQEFKIQEAILKGLSNKEIAETLFISVSTVKSHINTLYKKRSVSSRKELIEKDSNGV